MTQYYFKSIFLILPICSSKILLFNKSQENEKEIMKCVIKIGKQFFTNESVVVTNLNITHGEKFFDESLWSTTIISKSKKYASLDEVTNAKLTRSKNYVIVVQEPNKIEDIIQILKSYISWNPHAKFVIVLDTGSELEIKQMLEKLFWENNIVLSAVVTPMDKKVNIYHLKNKRYCKKEYVTLAKLEKCIFSSDLFDQKYRIPDTLFNCPLKIGYVKVSPYVLKKNNKLDGLDIKIVEAITQKLSMSLELTLLSTEAVGNIDDNLTFTGSMLQLHENKLDVLIGMIGAYDRQYFFMNMFNPNFLDKILWCVPRQMILESFHLLDFMDTYLWFILPLVFVTSSLLTAKFSQMLLNENNFFKPWSNSFLATFQYILGASVLATPRTVPVRYLIASFLIFIFFVKSALETFLTSSMSSPKYFQKVTSLQDVMKYNAKFYGLEGAKMYLVIFKDQIDHANLKRVIDNWQMCPDLNSCMDNFMMDQNGIASVSDFFIMHYLSQNISQSSQVHCFKSMEFGAIASTFYVPLGFPLFDKFQTIIERLKKGGFLHKWARDHSQIIKSYQRSEMEYNRINAGTSTLKLWNLEYIFRVIIYCYVGALIVFVLEVVVKKWRRKNDFLKIGFLK